MDGCKLRQICYVLCSNKLNKPFNSVDARTISQLEQALHKLPGCLALDRVGQRWRNLGLNESMKAVLDHSLDAAQRSKTLRSAEPTIARAFFTCTEGQSLVHAGLCNVQGQPLLCARNEIL